jgi:hypothetical protein
MKDINKGHFKSKLKKMMHRNKISIKVLEVSLSCLHFSLMFSEGEVSSLPIFKP